MSQIVNPVTNTQTDRCVAIPTDRRRAHQHWSSPFAAKRIHLIGIGGCGMASLGGVLLRCGAIVSGSDLREFGDQAALEEMGATIRIGQAPVNISKSCDLVVYSAAIRQDNPELVEAKRRVIPCVKYSEMLGQVMRLRTGHAIAGTHGKSTTTALLAYILRRAGLDPTFVVGAGVRQLGGGSGVGDGPDIIVEACEFDRSFLNLAPKYAAILNIEEDHLDCFDGIGAINEAFRSFASLVPADGVVIANGEDRNVAAALESIGAPIETFGFGDEMTWQARDVTHEGGRYRFHLTRNGDPFLDVRLDGLYGRHQVLNATVAAALAHRANVAPDAIADALRTFEGADRRMKHKGEVGGILILDDYGHHPTEIQVTLRAVKERFPDRRLWVVFQPHQHSRTRFLLNDFARSFGSADRLLIPDIYFVRDSEQMRDAICSEDLVKRVHANGGDATYLPRLEEITQYIVENARSGDVVLTMGAGDVWKISDELVRRLA
ncbi:MAG TPA: UDP-N-acetylmuramate--L-alanine ligase [Phycisphaerae bacterium]|nr:UDP-N-acetylmuramate--L-alanine ligase [Phycisphaerae bacterium]HRW55429.1 UDP-N-acetylmuramate--L-alanine ligase [Phycisphaerae bacterium]